MSYSKTFLSGAVALGVSFTGTVANAEPVAARTATPGVVSVKAIKLARTVAPATRGSRAVETTDILIGLGAAGLAGVAAYEASKGNDSPGG